MKKIYRGRYHIIIQSQATQNQSNQKLVEDLVIKQQKIVELNTIIIDRDAELDDLIL